MCMSRRARRRHRYGSPLRRLLIGILALVVTAAGVAVVWVVGVYDSAPGLDTLRPLRQAAVSTVYAADGSRLGAIHFDTERDPVPGGRIAPVLKQATVAIEDRNFFHEGGIDPEAIVRASWRDLLAGGKPRQGGSTITQQLVRDLYIRHPSDTLKRKIVEAHLANDENARFSKDAILTEYLNTAPYGTNDGATAIGVQAAAETYFSTPASRLTVREAALIAGLPQAPTDYNPLLHPRLARERRDEVLRAMESQGYISHRRYARDVRAGLGLHPSQRYAKVREPYVFDLVRRELVRRYGLATVRRGGLKVYTTIQPRLQEAAQRAVDACAVCYPDGGPASALASVDPASGAIVALASSTRYSRSSQFDFAAQAHRQPGSSFKTFVLTTAIKQGVDPDKTYLDGSSPMTLTIPGGAPWTVHNAEPGHGTMSLAQATWNSVDVAYAQLALAVGVRNFADTAYAMGITSPLGTNADGRPCRRGANCFIPPAAAIGGLDEGVTPLEMADAYATLADGGVRHRATTIARVVFPDGHVDRPARAHGTRVLTRGQAYDVTRVLEGVITRGTGAGYTSIGCSAEAGKTGTTDDESDAWFVGYTPRFATAVWTGHPLSRAPTGFGGPTSGPIWRAYMTAAQGHSCPAFPVPGKLPELAPLRAHGTPRAFILQGDAGTSPVPGDRHG
jgi:penicillin-binding protein 1A